MLRENAKQPVPTKTMAEDDAAPAGKENVKSAKKGAKADKPAPTPAADKKAGDKKEAASTGKRGRSKKDDAPAEAAAPEPAPVAAAEPAAEPEKKAPAAKKAKKADKADKAAAEEAPAAPAEDKKAAAAKTPAADKKQKAAADDKAATTDKKSTAKKAKTAEVKEEEPAPAPAEAKKGKKTPAAKADAKAADKAETKKAASAKKDKAAAAPAPKKEESDEEMEEAEVKVEEGEDGDKRAAAKGKTYKEGGAGRTSKRDYIEVVEEEEVAGEAEALAATAGDKSGAKRRLVGFALHDREGQPVSLERALLLPQPPTLSGCVYPAEGELAKSAGRRVAGEFGPLKEWKLVFGSDTASTTKGGAKGKDKGGEGARPTVVLRTASALYECVRPAPGYRTQWAQADEQLELCQQVFAALAPEQGGNPASSWEEVLAKLARTKVCKSYGSARDALLLNAKFLLAQLPAMTDATKARATTPLQDTVFGKALAAEVAKGPHVTRVMTNGITINEGGAAAAAPPTDALAAADEELARRLQAKMDAQTYGNAAAAGGAGRGKGAAYIRISEQEIADDYPLPKQYTKEVEETDELLMVDPDDLAAGIHPDDLPRRTLTDFAFYNSEGFLSSLELVPMFTGVDHDVEVFGSGAVADDDGEFGVGGVATDKADEEAGAGEGSGSGSAGSAGGAAKAQEGAMRLYLSQVREWCVEVSCDMMFLSVRTDVAWYRLVKPQEAYAPWYKTVLRAARLAVRILTTLADEARASRLSFNDLVKRLAELPEDDPAFVSKKPDRVERFVVVHGQIILNQFSVYPKKEVQRAAFVGELKARMETRKHHKLYMGKARAAKGTIAKARNANPMKNRAAVGLKAKPMPATATTMVKAVWRGYFFNGGIAQRVAEAEDAKAAKEVEEDENEEDEEGATEDALAAASAGKKKGAAAAAKASKPKKAGGKAGAATFVGSALRKDAKGRTLYGKAKVGGVEFALGDVVELAVDEEEAAAAAAGEEGGAAPAPEHGLGLVCCLYEDKQGSKMVQVRVLLRGADTVLGDVASDDELFVTESVEEVALSEVTGKSDAARLAREWRWEKRLDHFKEDEELRKRNIEARASGAPMRYVYRSLYKPQEGMFCALPAGLLDVAEGAFIEPTPDPVVLGLMPGGATEGFIKDGVQYKIGDVLFLHPQTFAADASAPAKKGKKAAAAKKPAKKKARKAESDEEEEAESSAAESSEAESSESEEEEAAPAKGKKGAKAAPAKKAAAAKKGKAPKKEESDEEMEEAEEEQQEKGKGKKGGAAKRGRAEAKKADKGSDKAGTSKEAAEQEEGEEKAEAPAKKGGRKGKHKGSNEGMRAFGLAQLVAVEASASKKLPARVVLRRLYRPEDISSDLAYKSAWWDVYAGPLASTTTADVDEVVGKAAAAIKGTKGVRYGDIGTELPTFCVVGSYDGKAVGPAPASLALNEKKTQTKEAAAAAAAAEEEHEESDVAMASLDIFAGCGGLSEGMHQAGVAKTKWAVEYDQAAADAFKLNNPDAEVFCNNCNVLLRAAMAKAGILQDCDACDDCMEAAAALTPEYTAGLPLPGEVEFIMGGPPCQGYSGMNRFNKGNWSMVQNSMVMAYLSYADFYRPRYFLLENVRNFVSHNKSFTFRLTLRTLLAMGYQVRFGVLNAGNYGVPQSRKRTIIWAAAPDEALPAWPAPRHVFHSPQLTINLPGGVAYTAVPNAPGGGAPLRPVTVRDAIADLPAIENGHQQLESAYTHPPTSAFQRFIRQGAGVLRDHICKEMNELNLERCRCIPKDQPGADWRVLMDIVKNDPGRELYKGQPLVPWCLPNTMDRHNGWRGLFGRLDLNGHFPTSTTDPQPMGKVGQVFHPTQDRIVSVRECARSQGFPDTFCFSGNVHNKHRQVGNAVPPPLAHALGSRLRTVLEERRKAALDAALAAQFD